MQFVIKTQNHRYPKHTKRYQIRDYNFPSDQPSNMHITAKIPRRVSSLRHDWPGETPVGLACFVGGKDGISPSLANLSPCTTVFGLIVDVIVGIPSLLHMLLVQHFALHFARVPDTLA